MNKEAIIILLDSEMSKIEFEYEECLRLIGSCEESDSINLLLERFKQFKQKITNYENN